MAVSGRIRDIGQNVLQSSFQTGRCSSPSYFQLVFLIAILEEAFIINIIIIPCINYRI
jgi:hypothetical protein